MTKELIYQLKDFEIFVEKLEEFINGKIKADPEVQNGTFNWKDYDLRTFDTDFQLPKKLEDYFSIWEYVCNVRNDFKKDKNAANSVFFDAYWNDMEGHSAYYDEKTLWIEFDEENIIYK